MPLMDKIENLQKKPESYKKKVLFFSLIIIMAVIISVWIFTLSLSSSEKNSQIISSSPMQVLKEDFNNLKNTIKNSFNQIKDEKSEQ